MLDALLQATDADGMFRAQERMDDAFKVYETVVGGERREYRARER